MSAPDPRPGGDEARGLEHLAQARRFLQEGLASRAAEALGAGRQLLGENDPDVVEVQAEVSLLRWDIGEATTLFHRLLEFEEDAYVLERCALLADLAEDHDRAHELLVRARSVDPARPAPVQVPADRFGQVIEEALLELPDTFRKAVESVAIVPRSMPGRDLIDETDPAATPPDVLGLFVGPTIHELAEERPAELPPTIYLFQRNLERLAQDEEDLAVEIRVTLFHEIGHLLGLDEDEVAAMGLA